MPSTEIVYGASGWRGSLGDDFTFFNLRRVTRAVARHVRHENRGRAPRLFVGYDTRFLSEQLAREVASVLLSEGVKPRLASDFVPAPAATHAIRRGRLEGGILLAADGEPCERQGFRFSPPGGAPASRETIQRIDALIRETPDGSPPPSMAPSEIKPVDPGAPYRASVLRFIDRKAVARGRLRLICDAAHGAGRGYLLALLSPLARVTSLRSDRDVRFGGATPDCGEEALAMLRAEVRRSGAHLGLATDSCALRLGVVDQGGRFIPAGTVLALLADYLLETRGLRSGIARTMASTRLLDDVAESHGVALFETPVGFGNFRDLLLHEKLVLAVDEDAGAIFPAHLPERDGILAACLVAEMVASRGKNLGEQIRGLFRKLGPRHGGRREFRLGDEDLAELPRRLESPPASLAGLKVRHVRTLDGTLMALEDGSWLLVRTSTTKPLVHCYAEARSPKELPRLLDAGRAFILAR